MLAGEQYATIGAEYGQKKEAIRSAVRAAIASGALERPTAARPVITGVGAADTTVDPEVAWEQACRAWEATARIAEAKAVQTIAFERGPICIAAVADIHAGATGVDYPRVDRELGVIRDTDGIYAILNGDIVDNMIIGKLLATRMGEGVSIPSEWAIARRVLGMVASKTLVVVGGNHDCHDAETECLTRRGWLTYDQIRDDDEVLSFVADSETCEWTRIDRRIVKDFDGALTTIETNGVSAHVTPNHRVLNQSRPGNAWGGWGYTPAADMAGRFRLPVSAQSDRPGADLSDDEIRLAGWVLTDGSISADGAHRRVALYQSKDYSEIVRLLDSLGLNYRHVERDRVREFVAGRKLVKPPLTAHEFVLDAESSRRVCAFLPGKSRMPDWTDDLDERQFDIFLSAIVAGDGNFRRPRAGVVYGARAFLDRLQSLAVRHGWRARISLARESDWRLNLCKTTTISMDAKVATGREEYAGKVWCLTVPHGNFMVRRKGAAHFSGNCWTQKLSGIDYFRETVAAIAPSALYDSDDCEWDLSVGSSSWRCRARHKWLGSSIYNPTHGMERASKFDRPVDIAFGAHTHVSGLIRMYNNHGRTGYAVQCGAYKVHDSYARVSGFARPNGSTAVALILHDDGNVAMYDDIATAARHMNALGNLGWV